MATTTPELAKPSESNAPPPGVRAARIEAILRATLEHIALVGYQALSVEDIALKAGVAKTTIYRRWPTKKELVQAALASVADSLIVRDTGTLRGDLAALGLEFVALSCSMRGQSLYRLCVTATVDPELQAVSDEVRCQTEDAVEAIVHRAIARGELAADTDTKLFLEAFAGPLHLKCFFHNERVDEMYISRLIDLLLQGAQHPAARAAAVQRPAARPSRRARK